MDIKLYAFDSCPYCVRVRALIGLKSINCEIEYLVAGSPPEPLVNKVNAFTVPMLEWPAISDFMLESSEIMRYLDGLDRMPLFECYQASDRLQQWFERVKPLMDALCYPRMPALGLPELGSIDALQFFEVTRERKMGMSLQRMWESTVDLLAQLEPELETLIPLLDIDRYLNGDRRINTDDVCAFAELRNLSMVQALRMPDHLVLYIERLSNSTGVPLYSPVSRFDVDGERVSV